MIYSLQSFLLTSNKPTSVLISFNYEITSSDPDPKILISDFKDFEDLHPKKLSIAT